MLCRSISLAFYDLQLKNLVITAVHWTSVYMDLTRFWSADPPDVADPADRFRGDATGYLGFSCSNSPKSVK